MSQYCPENGKRRSLSSKYLSIGTSPLLGDKSAAMETAVSPGARPPDQGPPDLELGQLCFAQPRLTRPRHPVLVRVPGSHRPNKGGGPAAEGHFKDGDVEFGVVGEDAQYSPGIQQSLSVLVTEVPVRPRVDHLSGVGESSGRGEDRPPGGEKALGVVAHGLVGAVGAEVAFKPFRPEDLHRAGELLRRNALREAQGVQAASRRGPPCIDQAARGVAASADATAAMVAPGGSRGLERRGSKFHVALGS